jgi:hypothetical protein
LLFDVSTDGSIQWFPFADYAANGSWRDRPRQAQDTIVRPGETLTTTTFQLGLPAGVETFKLIVSTDFDRFETYDQTSVAEIVTSRGEPGTKGFIQSALLPDWTTTSADIRITKKAP